MLDRKGTDSNKAGLWNFCQPALVAQTVDWQRLDCKRTKDTYRMIWTRQEKIGAMLDEWFQHEQQIEDQGPLTNCERHFNH